MKGRGLPGPPGAAPSRALPATQGRGASSPGPVPGRTPGPPRRDLVTRATLRPGSEGTKKLLRLYGDTLVRVRYLEDPVNRTRLTTVELVVDERPSPPPRGPLVAVRVGPYDVELRLALARHGGRFDPVTRLWLVPASAIRPLGLRGRLVRPPGT